MTIQESYQDENVRKENDDVLELQLRIGHKYRNVEKNSLNDYISADNVFCMTKDEKQYDNLVKNIIPFLIKYLNNDQNFDLADLVTNGIHYEFNSSTGAFWITNSLLFKPARDCYEDYSEVFNMYLMRHLGLNGGADYALANFDGNRGVVTKKLYNENEEFVTGSFICRKYKCFNSLVSIPSAIKCFCEDYNYIYDEEIEAELLKLFLYDLITIQIDRHWGNWGIICDELTRKVRLTYYDNSAIMFFWDPDLVEQFNDLHDYSAIENVYFTKGCALGFCTSDQSDGLRHHIWHLKLFLTHVSTEQKQIFLEMFEQITPELIDEIIVEMEESNGCLLPDDFKDALFICFDYQKSNIEKLIADLNEQKTRKFKLSGN